MKLKLKEKKEKKYSNSMQRNIPLITLLSTLLIWLYQWLQRKVSYFLTTKNCIVFKYLINNQNEKEQIFKIRKFLLFIYLLCVLFYKI